MNTRRSLMLLAASALAPIGYAQTEAPASTPTATLQQMSAAPAASATVEQRAAKLGSLALLPADTEFFFTIPNLGASFERATASRWLQALNPDEDYMEDLRTDLTEDAFSSLTISTGAQSSQAVAHLMPIILRMAYGIEQMDKIDIPYPEETLELSTGDDSEADDEEDGDSLDEDIEDVEPTPEALEKQKQAREKQMAREAKRMEAWDKYRAERDKKQAEIMIPILKDLSEAPLPNVLAIIELSEDNAATAREGIDEMRNQFEKYAAEEATKRGITFTEGDYAGLHWQGIHFDGATLVKFLEEDRDSMSDSEKELAQAVSPGLAGREASILTAMQGNKLIISICTDPAKEIKLAKTPQESILATDKVAFADARLDKNPDLLFYVDKKFQEALSTAIATQLGSGKISIPGINADTLVNSYVDMLKMVQPAAITGILWQDKGIHAEMAYGQDKTIDPNATLKLASMADLPSTILYGESISTQAGLKTSLAYVGHSLRQLASSFALPELATLWMGVETITEGLQGGMAVVVDNQSSLPADMVPAPELAQLQVPRIGFYASVQNRDSILAGWKTVADSFAKLQSKNIGIIGGADGPTSIFVDGKAMSLIQTELNDKQLVISASQPFNQQIAETAAKATGTLKGGAFVLRMAPIKAMVDKDLPLADKMGMDTKKVREVVDTLDKAFDGVYGTVTPETNGTRIHLYVKEK